MLVVNKNVRLGYDSLKAILSIDFLGKLELKKDLSATFVGNAVWKL